LHNFHKKTSDSGKISCKHCIIYWQLNCQISVISAKANNNYSGFCEVTPKPFSF